MIFFTHLHDCLPLATTCLTSPPPFLLIFICIKTAAFNAPSQQPPYCPSHLMQLLYSFHSDLCHDLTPAPYFPSPELLPQKRKTPSPLNCLSFSTTKEKEETNTRGPKKKTPGGRIGGRDHKKKPKGFLELQHFQDIFYCLLRNYPCNLSLRHYSLAHIPPLTSPFTVEHKIIFIPYPFLPIHFT